MKIIQIIKIADFFCGVGGIRLGFEQADNERGLLSCVFSNDIDAKAISTYELNFPSHRVNRTSVSELKIEDIPDFDIFLGGFPCQSFSLAGNKKGFDDERGNLFFDIIRILKAKKPKAFFLENVKNLRGHDNGQTYATIKDELLKIGYTFKTKILNTCKHGNIPQNRERIFLVGFLDRNHTEKFSFPKKIRLTKRISDFLEEDSAVGLKYYYTDKSKIYPKLVNVITEHIRTNQVYQYRRHYVRENKSDCCPTLTANMGSGGHNVPIILDDKGIRKLTPRECFNLQGFPSEARGTRSFALTGSDSALYKQAGNSVSVPIIKRIAKKMLNVLRE